MERTHGRVLSASTKFAFASFFLTQFTCPSDRISVCLLPCTALRIVSVMAAAEDKSWEYTLGRIDERTENIEKRLTRVEGELATVKDAMLTKGTFFTVLGIVSSIIVAFLVYIVSNLG